jgi:tRNA A-37 threonylcarbamoyl transferase component Bud32
LLESNQAEAEVLLDGQKIGETGEEGKFYSAEIPVGEHRISVQKSGYETVSMEETFEAGLTTTVSLSLKKRDPPEERESSSAGTEPTTDSPQSSRASSLIVSTNVGGATVFVDGREVGKTHHDGKLEVSTAPGPHRVRIEKDGFEADIQTVEAPPGALTKTVEATLPRAEGLLGQLGSLGMSQPTVVLALVLVAGIFALAVVIVVLQDGTAAQPTQTNRQFDRYGVGDRIGEGGMATVYAARDQDTDREVALKIMARQHLDDPDLVRKFLKEGEALKRVHSSGPQPPIVKAYRHGREGGRETGRPFLALERLEGAALIDVLDRAGTLPPRPTLRIVETVCRGLEAAHRCDIWHRDVTPENVIVLEPVPTSRLKLIDFGVAKHEYTRSGTLDGSITGKPPYMSPEQCRGETVNGKTDVYSLGVLTFALLRGSPPFTDQNPVQVLKMHQERPPPDLPGAVPKPVRNLVGDMLRKDPDTRPSSRQVKKRVQTVL